MARRRKREEEPVNQERWLVSYADFITLLFAFFVVMYSISSVNEGKYRVLSDSLSQTFSEDRGLDPIQIGEVSRSIGVMPESSEAGAEPESGVEEVVSESELPDEPLQPEAQLAAIADKLKSTMSALIEDDLVDIKQNQYWVEVNIKSSMLFASGSSRLSRNALQALRKITRIIKPIQNIIHVEGYTDSVPIDTLFYPSNWELSAARAASVVHLFARLGILPSRLAAIGYGEHHPIADNSTEEGRSENRRVSLVILARGSSGGKVLPRALNPDSAVESIQTERGG